MGEFATLYSALTAQIFLVKPPTCLEALMRVTIPVVLFLMLLTIQGCAGRTDEKISQFMNVGPTLDQMIQAFGPPAHVAQAGDDSVYIWRTQYSQTSGGYPIYTPNTQRTTGSVYLPDGRVGTYSASSYGGAWTNTPVHQHNYQCEVRVMVRPDKSIITWSYQGNACDDVIINTVSPATPTVAHVTADTSRRTEACLETVTKSLVASMGKDQPLDVIADTAEEMCQRQTGYIVPNLSRYYARQALDEQ